MIGPLGIESGRPGLLVSVRSAVEARAAVLGGAAVIDVKEPDRGPLGCADPEVWRSVREAVPFEVPVSVALGELRDWIDLRATMPPPSAFEGIAFRKVGLSGMAGIDWRAAWERVRDDFGPGPPWIAVAYLDADRAEAPSPDEVRAVALETPGCSGLLLDTWEKTLPGDLRSITADWIDAVRHAGRVVAVAGGLDAIAIVRLNRLGLRPDLFAVRGSACDDGWRGGTVDRDRVRRLVEAIARDRVGA